MIGHDPGRDEGRDFPELDTMIEEEMSGILARVETVFDPRERFASFVRRTAGPTPPDIPRTDTVTDSATLAAVCDRIDGLDHFLLEAVRAGDADPFPGSAFLDAARQPLRQLRANLAGRTATREQAEQLLRHVEQNITQTDTILGGGLDDALNQLIPGRVRSVGPISEQLPALRTSVVRLYEDARDISALTPFG